MLKTIRQSLYLMGRAQRKLWFMLVGLALLTSGLEIVAAALVFVLLGLVANPDGNVALPLLGDIRGMFGGGSERTMLLTLIGIMVGFFILRFIAAMVTQYVMTRVVQNSAARLSTRLVRGYLGLPYSYHLTHSSSEVIRNGHQAILEVVYSVFTPLIRVTAEVLMVFGILVLLVLVSPIGTALALGVVGGSTLILLLVVQPRQKRFGTVAHAMHKETLGSLSQSVQGVRDIKVLGRERFFSDAYGSARRRLARMMYLRDALDQLPRLVIETSLILFILVFFAFTIARGSGAQGALSILGLFAYAGLRLQPSLQKIVGGFNSIRFSTAPVADIYRDLKMIEASSVDEPSPDILPFSDEIAMEGVSFTYEGADSPALSGVDLRIKRGEQIGICGPTGGGKSTLVDIIVGLTVPNSGKVTVDGKDITSDVRAWQRNLGVVSQMVFLVDDSLRRNIAFGVPDGDIDEDAVREAVELAQLESFLASLPTGLDSVVGERGVRISGGERQRIAVARALYHRPEVLIFDEGTSALDRTTEQELMNALRRLRGTHTILLVAHRLSTVRDADRVVFVRNGKVEGVGTFEGLKEENSLFREMAASS